MQSASQSPRATKNGNGCWANSAMISTATTAPAKVPTTWAKLRLRAIPASGWLTMTTVISAHFGCSRSKRKAR